MKMRHIWALAAAALPLAAAQAQPPVQAPGAPQPRRSFVVSPIATPELVTSCADPAPTGVDTCTAYVWGVADALSMNGQICPSTEDWGVDSVAIVRLYLATHQSEYRRHPAFLIREALQREHPCPPAPAAPPAG